MTSRPWHTLLTLTLVGLVVSAESVASEAGASPQLERATRYLVGPGDRLEVSLPGDESYLLTVQHDGVITLLSQKLKVGGLAVVEVRQRVQSHLEALGLSGDRVAVRVKDYGSQVAFITGEVVRPGRYYLSGNDTVVDVLLRAGGFARRASGEVIVESATGGLELQLSLEPGMTEKQQRQILDIPLADGDVIRVIRRAPGSRAP